MGNKCESCLKYPKATGSNKCKSCLGILKHNIECIVETPKCKSYKCNHALDPEEWDCDEKECIEIGECKYLNQE